MATPDLTAGQVMDSAAALLNDAAKTIYTYTAQIPYLNIALQELEELFELNEVPVVDTVTSTPMDVPAGTTAISFTAVSGLVLPSNLVEPQILWERTHGIDPYYMMRRVDSLPRFMEGTQIAHHIYYTWQSQEIRFFASIQRNDIKMDYIRNLFATVTVSTDAIGVINAASFLHYRTAGLCAEFIGENKTRGDSLNGDALLALDRSVGIGTKGRQSIMTRHRPFRSSYKRRSYQ